MTRVWVTHRFIGWHYWPDAPPHRNYLRTTHRHLFHVRAEVEVEHDDREVEFHDLLSFVQAHTPEDGTELGEQSCEMIAAALLAHLSAEYGNRSIAVEVSEDGECGARVEVRGRDVR